MWEIYDRALVTVATILAGVAVWQARKPKKRRKRRK